MLLVPQEQLSGGGKGRQKEKEKKKKKRLVMKLCHHLVFVPSLNNFFTQ